MEKINICTSGGSEVSEMKNEKDFLKKRYGRKLKTKMNLMILIDI